MDTQGFISIFTLSRVPETPECDMGLDSGAYPAPGKHSSSYPAPEQLLGTGSDSKVHKKCYPAPETRYPAPGLGTRRWEATESGPQCSVVVSVVLRNV